MLSTPLPIAVLCKTEGLGDACLRLPFLRQIASRFPDRPLWWISANKTAIAASIAPLAAGMITELREDAGICGRRRDVEPRLRALPPFSIVFDLRTGIRDVWLARRFLQYQSFVTCLPAYLFSDVRPPGRILRPWHTGLRALSMAEAILRERIAYRNELTAAPEARAAALSLLPDGRTYIGLTVCSGEPFKTWSLERFAALADGLHRRGIAVVLMNGIQPADSAQRIAAVIPHAIDPGTLTDTADGLIAVAQRLTVLVANDTGIAHICGAAGCPIVSLFGRTDPRRYAPIAPVCHVVRAGGAGRRIDTITVEAVVQGVLTTLAAANAVVRR